MQALIERILTDESVRDQQIAAYSALDLLFIPWLGSPKE